MRLRAWMPGVCALLLSAAPAASMADWSDWDAFASRFLQADGRIIDLTFEGKSTSEGQSYGLFFALVANRRQQFESIYHWTSNNLAGGKLCAHLPAWHWGRRPDGTWGVKDENPAADGDIWLAYTLIEAGRLWKAPEFSDCGRGMLGQVREKEVTDAGASGPVLLPGPYGFVLQDGRFRVDPSYVPGFVFARFAAVDQQGPWAAIASGMSHALLQTATAGVAPDLLVLGKDGSSALDADTNGVGSYDAIRIYLWAGMWKDGSAPLLAPFKHYAELTRSQGSPPEKVDARTGQPIKSDSGYSPIGFSGALLPYLRAIGDEDTLKQQLDRLQQAGQNTTAPPNYYDQALILFGKGWLDGQFRFNPDGELIPKW